MTNPRRDVDVGIELARVPRDWCADDAFSTTFMAALSLLFPRGEQFFVDSVKQLRHHATGELAVRVHGFIGQEAMHGREHRAFNELCAAQGLRGGPGIERRLARLLGAARHLSPESQLAITCALEHFTAMLAEQLLANERLRGEIHPAVRPLWLWHALEESEHKAVAFDVYRAAGGGTLRRVWMMVVTTAMFFAVQGAAHARLMGSRGILLRPWRWLRGIARMWIWPGYFIRLVPAYLSYFRPGFHPNDRDNGALVATWRGALFGEAGMLRDRVA
ncbi:MAG TPA: metal-dependent hydrolase [Kofleriaceae bacterium]|nr:metal-dependent hydrolase [Kofleriaceae bacterium]